MGFAMIYYHLDSAGGPIYVGSVVSKRRNAEVQHVGNHRTARDLGSEFAQVMQEMVPPDYVDYERHNGPFRFERTKRGFHKVKPLDLQYARRLNRTEEGDLFNSLESTLVEIGVRSPELSPLD